MKIEDVKENSVELWIKEHWPPVNKELTPDQAHVFLQLCENEEFINKAPEVNTIFSDGLEKILHNMLKNSVKADVTPAAELALHTIANTRSPGECLMINAYVQYKCNSLKLDKLTARDVGMHIFPNGAPSHEEFTKLWDVQKIPGHMPDNMLNITKAYNSIYS